MPSKIPTTVEYLKALPPFKKLQPPKSKTDFLFIVDRKVLGMNPALKEWLKPAPHVYAVEGGEGLKDLEHFPSHLQNIFKILAEHNHRGLSIVAIGGGSITDFAGFVASIFKRGIDLILLPSSWLAAIDSAHGGKNGLNLNGLKNQIGTIYHPRRVYVVEALLRSQSEAQIEDALGEFYKMALLTKKAWGKQFISTAPLRPADYLRFLPEAIAEKYAIVSKDPLETKGIRQILNLGHTLGHVIELEQKIPHGRAVAIGLKFAIEFSHDKGHLKTKTLSLLKAAPLYRHLESLRFQPLTEKKFRAALLQDKKRKSTQLIQFVFLKDLGAPILIDLTINDLVKAGKKYGFITPS